MLIAQCFFASSLRSLDELNLYVVQEVSRSHHMILLDVYANVEAIRINRSH